MRKLISRTVATAALATIAIAPLAGTAAASSSEHVSNPATASGRCWDEYGDRHCSDDYPHHGHHWDHGVGIGVGLGLGILL